LQLSLDSSREELTLLDNFKIVSCPEKNMTFLFWIAPMFLELSQYTDLLETCRDLSFV